MQLKGNGLDIFVIGRKIQLTHPQQSLEFKINSSDSLGNFIEQKFFSQSTFLELAIKDILKSNTKFGRIGIIIDRQDTESLTYFDTLDLKKFTYQPKSKTRALKSAEISVFKTPLLKHLATEGFGDSVEFRRLSRKYLRAAKHANVDCLLFADLIFGEKSTKKVLQSILGTQIKAFTLDDFYPIPQTIHTNFKNDNQKSINLKLPDSDSENIQFIKQRAQEILQCKISAEI